nr:putative uncharacterized hydrolase c7d4.05 [Quercus suber]
MPSRRNLLIAFDAFGTLFQPRRPIAQQYSEVARSLGLKGFGDEDVEAEFRKGPDPRVGEQLVPRLLYRFSTEEGYMIFPDVTALLKTLSKDPSAAGGKVVVGVVTNSDDRVPDVLTSLGLRVSPHRYGQDLINSPPHGEIYDIDFSVMSYDVGHEKPDERVFKAAESMLWKSRQAVNTDPSSWDKLYVGDDYEKDIVGAVNAGWRAVWIHRGSRINDRGLEWLDDRPPGKVEEMFRGSRAVAFSDLNGLSKWLPRQS